MDRVYTGTYPAIDAILARRGPSDGMGCPTRVFFSLSRIAALAEIDPGLLGPERRRACGGHFGGLALV